MASYNMSTPEGWADVMYAACDSKDQYIQPRCSGLLLYIGMEKQMESTIVCWGYIGIMEKKMETTIVSLGSIGFRVLGFFRYVGYRV